MVTISIRGSYVGFRRLRYLESGNRNMCERESSLENINSNLAWDFWEVSRKRSMIFTFYMD
uniref:Uncharacterized protein n=1 Tax=Rhizophora mucronata TaxID=61149 RepID=A0A2P2R1L3_RHIMU